MVVSFAEGLADEASGKGLYVAASTSGFTVLAPAVVLVRAVAVGDLIEAVPVKD